MTDQIPGSITLPFLRIGGLLALLGGLLMAWFIWNNFGTVQVPVGMEYGPPETESFTSTPAIVAACLVALQGAVASAALFGLAAAVENTIEIRRGLK